MILTKLTELYNEKKLSKKYVDILTDFYLNYKKAVDTLSAGQIDNLFGTFLQLLSNISITPYKFPIYHQKITKPFNYLQFGLDFLKPLVDFERSRLYGTENLKKIQTYLTGKENVILFANHQSETDPMMIYLLLEKDYPKIASQIIYVAGERVITDPLAIPFSMGCNLLCIYSKRYIDIDLKLKHQKQIHNKKAMTKMLSLLDEGGKIIYVAPSGGRDRKDDKGNVIVAPFDPQSLELFYLICKKSKFPTHFFPLTLSTYNILPPPEKIQIEMGEKRDVNKDAIFVSFSQELDMENFPGSLEKNKQQRRKNRANYIHDIVKREYEQRKL